ncbi:hypothetical protein F5879DRAFT_1026589 [Lentinula edodes]|nr:hypothetical protein F5879DRAFT_1026589 [Lentinula edodes]
MGGSRPTPPPPADPAVHEEEEGLEDEDEDNIIRRAQERVKKKAAEASRKAAEERAARVAEAREKEAQEQALRAQQQEKEAVGCGGNSMESKGDFSQQGVGFSEEARSRSQENSEDLLVGTLMTATMATTTMKKKKKGLLANNAGCPYSGRPSTVKREGGVNPTSEHLAVLESQVAQLLADNWQLRDGQFIENMGPVEYPFLWLVHAGGDEKSAVNVQKYEPRTIKDLALSLDTIARMLSHL